ncbi:uncharacterized protein LOC123293629 [Chrysoperla carnea]|uniref:uncharacterized protein LOC123293629 n=1 Tax=Chrysoperla carnea TaxID=189513 RepID=UPI001D067D3B|nr:uncharacterized protein LOC123293629 [Chrysoperla carnea]
MPYARLPTRGLNLNHHHHSPRMYPKRFNSPCRSLSPVIDDCVKTPTVQVNINTKDDECCDGNSTGHCSTNVLCDTCESLGHWCGKCEHRNYYSGRTACGIVPCNTCMSLGHWCGKCEYRNYFGGGHHVPCNACSSLGHWCGKCRYRNYFGGSHHVPCNACSSLGHWCGKCQYRNYFGGSHHVPCNACSSLGHWCGKCQYRNYFGGGYHVPCNACASLGHWCGKCQYRNYFGGINGHHVPCNACSSLGHWCGKCQYRNYFGGGHHVPCNTCSSLGHWCGKCQNRNYFGGGHHVPCNACSSLGHWCGKCQYRNYFGGGRHHIPCNACSSLGHWCGKCEYRNYFYYDSPCSTCVSLGHWCGKCDRRSLFTGQQTIVCPSICNQCESLGHWCGKCENRYYRGMGQIVAPCNTCVSMGHWCGKCNARNYYAGRQIMAPCHTCESLGHWCGKCENSHYYGGGQIISPCNTCVSMGRWCGKCEARNYCGSQHTSMLCNTCESLGRWCGKCAHRDYYMRRYNTVALCNTCESLGHWCGKCEYSDYYGRRRMVVPCNTCESMGRWCGKCENRHYYHHGGGHNINPCNTCVSLGRWCGKCGARNYYGGHHSYTPCSTCESLGHWCGQCDNSYYYGGRLTSGRCMPQGCDDTHQYTSNGLYGLPTLDDNLTACGVTVNQNCYTGVDNFSHQSLPQFYGHGSDSCIPHGNACDTSAVRFSDITRPSSAPECISIDQCTDAIPTDIMDQFYDHLRAGSDHNLKRDQNSQNSANRSPNHRQEHNSLRTSNQRPENNTYRALNQRQENKLYKSSNQRQEENLYISPNQRQEENLYRSSDQHQEENPYMSNNQRRENNLYNLSNPYQGANNRQVQFKSAYQSTPNFASTSVSQNDHKRSPNQSQQDFNRHCTHKFAPNSIHNMQNVQNVYQTDHKSASMDSNLSKGCSYVDKTGHQLENSSRQFQIESSSTDYKSASAKNNLENMNNNNSEIGFQDSSQIDNSSFYKKSRNSIDVYKKRIFESRNDLSTPVLKTESSNLEDSLKKSSNEEKYNEEFRSLKKKKDVRFQPKCDKKESLISSQKQSIDTISGSCTRMHCNNNPLNHPNQGKSEMSNKQDDRFIYRANCVPKKIQQSINNTVSPNTSNYLVKSQLKNDNMPPKAEKTNTKEKKDCGTQFVSTQETQDFRIKDQKIPVLENTTIRGGDQMKNAFDNYRNMNQQNIKLASRIPQRKGNSHYDNSNLPPSRLDEYMDLNSRLPSLHGRSTNTHNTYTDSVRENLLKKLNESHLASHCDYYIRLLQQKDSKKSLERIRKFSSIRDLTEKNYRDTLQQLYDTINKVNACSFRDLNNCCIGNDSITSPLSNSTHSNTSINHIHEKRNEN